MDPYGASELIGTAVSLPILSILAVALRFYVRLRVRKTFIGIDDWLILAALPLVIGQNVQQVLGAIYGSAGRDFKPITKSQEDYENKLNHAVLVYEKFTFTLIKLSVLFFYRRIFEANRGFRQANNVLIVLVVLWGLVFLFTDSFACVSGPSGVSTTTCSAQQWISLWFAITEVVGDLAILLLPYPCLRKLQMARREKVGIGFVFALGAISTIVGIIRLGYVSKNFHGSAPTLWTSAEVSIGVVAACLPALSPLLSKSYSKSWYYAFRRKLSAGSNSGSSGGFHSFRKPSKDSAQSDDHAQFVAQPLPPPPPPAASIEKRVDSMEAETAEERKWDAGFV